MLADSDLPLFNWTPPNEETPEKFKRAPDDPRDFTAEWLAFVRWETSVWEIVLRFVAEDGTIHMTAIHQDRDEMREAEASGHALFLVEPIGAQIAALIAERA